MFKDEVILKSVNLKMIKIYNNRHQHSHLSFVFNAQRSRAMPHKERKHENIHKSIMNRLRWPVHCDSEKWRRHPILKNCNPCQI